MKSPLSFSHCVDVKNVLVLGIWSLDCKVMPFGSLEVQTVIKLGDLVVFQNPRGFERPFHCHTRGGLPNTTGGANLLLHNLEKYYRSWNEIFDLHVSIFKIV